jgi:probable F420-dependent oxidoreductase
VQFGAIYPHFEFGCDPAEIRAYAREAEALGLDFIGADDHVIGPNPERKGGYSGWTTYRTAFQEPFVLFSFLAGCTERLGFATCVLILPQRQTVLAAKQAAALDVLCGGQLRLGVGVGWSEIEYEALGQAFHNRGQRVDEQIRLMRQLWTQELVDFASPFHHVPDAGLNPLPVQRPIPIWIGGQSESAIRRAARLGDGWMPLHASAQEARAGLALLESELRAAGRERAGFGLEARIPYGNGDPGLWRELLASWQEAGATHAALVATGAGLSGAKEHIAALGKFVKNTH